MSFRKRDGSTTIGTDQARPYRTTLQVGDRLFVKPEETTGGELQLTLTSTLGDEAK